MSVSRVSDSYIDVTLSLDKNPGIIAFNTDLVFNCEILTPVSIEGYDFQGMEIALPTVESGRFTDRRIFAGISVSPSHTTGLISTTRFKVTGDIDVLPITIGHIDTTVCSPNYPYGINDYHISRSVEELLSYGIPRMHEFRPSSNPPADRVLYGTVRGGEWPTSSDAAAIAQYVVGQTPSPPFNIAVADVNMDGLINLADVTLLLRWAVGDNVLIGMDMYYSIITNSDGGAELQKYAEDIMFQISFIFRSFLRTNLIFLHTDESTRLNMRSGCNFLEPSFYGFLPFCVTPEFHGQSDRCGIEPDGSDCDDLHHRAGHRLVRLYWRNTHNTFRFVNFILCAYYETPVRPNGPRHSTFGGFASWVSGREMIVSVASRNEDTPLAITAHEIGHLLGAYDNRCTSDPNDGCIMSGRTSNPDNTPILNRLCANCMADVIRAR
jgi:hypothetical protein